MSRNAGTYRSYLLRLWREANHKAPVWRASLEDPSSGERIGFASLEELFVFVQQVCAPECSASAEGGKE